MDWAKKNDYGFRYLDMSLSSWLTFTPQPVTANKMFDMWELQWVRCLVSDWKFSELRMSTVLFVNGWTVFHFTRNHAGNETCWTWRMATVTDAKPCKVNCLVYKNKIQVFEISFWNRNLNVLVDYLSLHPFLKRRHNVWAEIKRFALSKMSIVRTLRTEKEFKI